MAVKSQNENKKSQKNNFTEVVAIGNLWAYLKYVIIKIKKK